LRCANLLDANLTDEQLKTAADIRLATTRTGARPLDHVINLSNDDWHKWESRQFKISATP